MFPELAETKNTFAVRGVAAAVQETTFYALPDTSRFHTGSVEGLTFSLRFDRDNNAPTVRDVTERVATLTEGACARQPWERPRAISPDVRQKESPKIVNPTAGGRFTPANTSAPAPCVLPNQQGSPGYTGRSTGNRNRCTR